MPDAETLELPEIKLGPIRYSIGYAEQVIRAPINRKIVSEFRVNVSARVTERGVELDGGERVLITDRSKVQRPNDIDGVLKVVKNGSMWINHRIVDEAIERINNGGLANEAENARTSWVDALRYIAEKQPITHEKDRGLRPPQLGALFSIGAHWSIYDTPATIVLPTGTGKTETMLAAVAAHRLERVLVIVPSNALRSQTANKFLRFGILRFLNVLKLDAINPVVGVVLNRPKTAEDLALLRDCNVVVASPSSLTGGTALQFLDEVATIAHTLIVDEAHHVAARTWRHVRKAFSKRRVLQFTATPFRNDGQLVDGSVIYSYPLSAAQKDNYFAPINFLPLYEIDEDDSDEMIAVHAIQQLRVDLKAGWDHLLMARCKTVARASEVYKAYKRLAPDLDPILIHSNLTDADERVEHLRDRSSRIVVCVNMLGEGVDIPELKIAAIHDSHQSLAVLLQFIGRFTRVGSNRIGEASVVANIANIKVTQSLEQLYSQDADWNTLLRELSSEAAREHAEFIRFLEKSTPFEVDDESIKSVSQQSLRPVFSTLFYHAPSFNPKRFHEGLPDRFKVAKVWLNDETNTLYFVTYSTDRVRWTRSKTITEVQWSLFVLHYDQKLNLLYLASTYKDSHFADLASAVGAKAKIMGEPMFRSLGRIGRLVFNNLGVTKHGRRNLSFAMYTGVDVKQALSEAETQGSRKSNVSGYGWEDGAQITIGCSYKGRVWSKMGGTIPKFVTWAEGIGAKLLDESIDTKSIIENVLIPDWADKFPDIEVLSLDWPYELLSLAEDRVSIVDGVTDHELFLADLVYEGIDDSRKQLMFSIFAGEGEDEVASYRISIDGQAGYKVTEATESNALIRIGRTERDLTSFFNDYPPLVRFVDLSEVDGNIILKAENSGVVNVPEDRLVPWSWTGVDIKKESLWKDGVERRDSIQWRCIFWPIPITDSVLNRSSILELSDH